MSGNPESIDGSSTTIYVPYIPNRQQHQQQQQQQQPAESSPLKATSTLATKKPSERRKLSKTIRDYKPSRQLQRQLSHQQRGAGGGDPTVTKLTSQSFKHLKSRRQTPAMMRDAGSSTTDRDSSSSSGTRRRVTSKCRPVTRAKSLSAQPSRGAAFCVEGNGQRRGELVLSEQMEVKRQPVDDER